MRSLGSNLRYGSDSVRTSFHCEGVGSPVLVSGVKLSSLQPLLWPWVALVLMGAPIEVRAEDSMEALMAAARTHWAFQPVKAPPVPADVDVARVRRPLDAFVLAKLAEKGLSLSPEADRATLIRRAYFNLVGVPPTAEEIEAFVADPDPEAFEKLVDRLLADPRFGERWGRYWLDVARYADSKGYVFQEERRYAYSYTYRDWVVRAFNEDLPYDKFILAQLAADQTLGQEDPRHLAAMGFLTLGRRFLNSEPDIIDDRLDVTFRGLQAITVGCARCHDHKFDPVPIADYYSLYGVFASSEEPAEKPLLGEPERTPAYEAFEAELAKKEQAVADFYESKKRALFEREAIEKYLQLCAEGWAKSDEELSALAKERKLYATVALRWREYLRQLGPQHPVAAPFLALVTLDPAQFEAQRDGALAQAQTAVTFNPLLAAALRANPPASLADVVKLYAELFSQHQGAEPLPEAAAEEVRLVMRAPEGLEGLEARKLHRDFSVEERGRVTQLRNDIEAFKANAEGAPPRAMVMVDKAKPVEPVIFKRGNRASPGAQVPRQFLAVLAGPNREPFKQGSGRLEMAQRIASADNPLTARVFVNRVWFWLTGTPLVDSPSDFGVRTPPPSNPELLDHLASSFVAHGWSMKWLIREIVLSSTWQQVSDSPEVAPSAPDPSLIDPENTLFWRMNRRRRDFESFRDSMLMVSGRLDSKMGGRPVDIDNPDSNRRTLYGFIDRQNLPGLFRAFDFASPDQHAPRRFQTTVPQQALFALNNPFVVRQAEALAALSAPDEKTRAQHIARRVLGRSLEEGELASALAFVSEGPRGQTAGAWEYGYGHWDAEAGRTRFTPLPWFGANRWSASEHMPDPELAYTMITATGGHPGRDEAHGVILRWQSPETFAVNVRGEVKRPEASGDGVRVRLVTSHQGLVREWDVPAGGTMAIEIDSLPLQAGEVVDFIIDPKATDLCDSFQFVPRLTETRTGQLVAAANEEFAGPPLDPWTAYAQVLLISNEFMFVD